MARKDREDVVFDTPEAAREQLENENQPDVADEFGLDAEHGNADAHVDEADEVDEDELEPVEVVAVPAFGREHPRVGDQVLVDNQHGPVVVRGTLVKDVDNVLVPAGHDEVSFLNPDVAAKSSLVREAPLPQPLPTPAMAVEVDNDEDDYAADASDEGEV